MRVALVVHFDLPRPVVGDHDQHRRLVAHRSVDLHRIEAEGPVAGRDDHLAIGKRQARGDAERGADADAAQRTRVEVGRRGQADPSEAQEVAAVGDHHRIRLAAARCSSASTRFGWMRRSLSEGADFIEACSLSARSSCFARRPCAQARSTAGSAIPGAGGRLRPAPPPAGEHLDRAAAVVAHLGGRIADPHETRVAEDRRRSVRELEIEPASDRHDHVGLAHDRSAHRRHDGLG